MEKVTLGPSGTHRNLFLDPNLGAFECVSHEPHAAPRD